ncbi:MAG: hypothetical protein HOY79_00110 [Streptomyces sp.]|nr:hypothetical protein [Streptomyces sp.]
MQDRSQTARLTLYGGVTVGLLGQLVDYRWHDAHVSFVPLSPGGLLKVHSLIYLGLLMVIAAGLLGLYAVRRVDGAGAWVGPGAVLLGGLMQLAGAALDMWAHAHDMEKDLYHNLVWYGLVPIAIGAVFIEFRTWRLSADGAPERIEETRSVVGERR